MTSRMESGCCNRKGFHELGAQLVQAPAPHEHVDRPVGRAEHVVKQMHADKAGRAGDGQDHSSTM